MKYNLQHAKTAIAGERLRAQQRLDTLENALNFLSYQERIKLRTVIKKEKNVIAKCDKQIDFLNSK